MTTYMRGSTEFINQQSNISGSGVVRKNKANNFKQQMLDLSRIEQ